MRRLLLGAVYFPHACSLNLLAHHCNEVQDGGGWMWRLLLGAVYFPHACSLNLLAHHCNEVQDGGGWMWRLLLGAVGRGCELGDEHLVDDVDNAL